MAKAKDKAKTIKIRQVHSGIGFPKKQKLVIKGLGFHRLNEVIERPDNPSIRGMIHAIQHLVEVVE